MRGVSNPINHRFILAARPSGMPVPSDWRYEEEAVRDPGDGELLVRVRYISLDPAMRGWMNDTKSYSPPVGLGEVMRSFSAGTVEKSNNPAFKSGDAVQGMFGVQRYAISKGERVLKGQVIGHVGGAASDQGAHLHFELRGQGGIALDPLNWLRRR